MRTERAVRIEERQEVAEWLRWQAGDRRERAAKLQDAGLPKEHEKTCARLDHMISMNENFRVMLTCDQDRPWRGEPQRVRCLLHGWHGKGISRTT